MYNFDCIDVTNDSNLESCSSAMNISLSYVVIVLVKLYIMMMHGLKFPYFSCFLSSGNGNLYYLSQYFVNQP